jgi:SsrA-binding protein
VYTPLPVPPAGLSRGGPEVTPLGDGRGNLTDSYARIKNGELYLYKMHISPYPFAHHMNLDPERTRKLLMNRAEIRRLIGKTEEKGYALIPLEVYFTKGWAKVDLALVRGKKKVDKRQAIKERDMKREVARARKKPSDAD